VAFRKICYRFNLYNNLSAGRQEALAVSEGGRD